MTTKPRQKAPGMTEEIPTFTVRPEGKPYLHGDGSIGIRLVFRCPRCGRKNVHGGTYRNKGADDGHRVSHCPCWPRGYEIRES